MKSLTFRIMVIFAGIYLAGIVFVLTVADHQLKEIIGQTREAEYRDELEHIWSALDIAVHRLNQTGMREVYEFDFQERVLANLRPAYYSSSACGPNRCVYPFIVDTEGKVLLHPNHKRGERFFTEKAYIDRMFAEQEGGITYQDEHGATVHCQFLTFPEWQWVVGMVVPQQVKYGDASRFKYRMIAIMTAGIILAGTVLLLIVARTMRPVKELTAASRALAAGNLDQEISIRARDEVGVLAESFLLMRDGLRTKIADLAEKNQKLHESEKRFRSLIQQAADGVFVHDERGELLDVNEQACQSLGYDREELLDKNIVEIDIDFSQGHTAEEDIWCKVTEGRPLTFTGRHRRKDGTTFPVEVRLAVFELNGQRSFLGIARDISERVRAQEEKNRLEMQLQHARQLEAIGRLSGGIAHDFNNILTPIIGYGELVKLQLPPDSQLSEDMDIILQSASRARDLVKQILTFSRQGKNERVPVQLHVVVKEALKLLRATIPVNIQICADIDNDCGQVLADPTQLHQIVMNLCMNGYHAMHRQAGTLAISLGRIEIDEYDPRISVDLFPGSYIRLEVSDNGQGMSEGVLSRIFDPYFTTKRVGEGNGFGLSIVHGIVKSYEGHITVTSEPDRGSTFHVYLPRIDTCQKNRDEGHLSLPRGNEHIMVVDDERQVAGADQRILSSLGYRVTALTDPRKAMARFSKSPRDYDMVITDMSMPGMTGEELAAELLAIRPDIPIILCTGFSEILNARQAKGMGIREYAMKPVCRDELATMVRRILTQN